MRPGIPMARTAADLFFFVAVNRIGLRLRPGDDPVLVRSVVEYPDDSGACAASCGVALVQGCGDKVLIGRESSLAMIAEVLLGEPSPRRSRMDCLRLLDDYEMASPVLRRSMDDQIALLKIQHKICEVFPDFRIWRGQEGFTTGGQEVQLRRTTGGKTLFGIVWGWEQFYTSAGHGETL